VERERAKWKAALAMLVAELFAEADCPDGVWEYGYSAACKNAAIRVRDILDAEAPDA
jgi:hypothetical protein